MNIEIGKVYLIQHRRNGQLTMRITDLTQEWITGVVVTGKTEMVSAWVEVEPGQGITLRRSYISSAIEQPENDVAAETNKWITCPHCNGTGQEFPECEPCEGNGWVDDPSDDGTMECPECRNEICHRCEGVQDIPVAASAETDQ